MVVGGMGVGIDVGETGVKVGGVGVVDRTCTEKLQASSNGAINRKLMISGNHFHCFIAFSLSTLANRAESGRTYFPRQGSIVGISGSE